MISIVILNWNGAKMMRKYLPSVIQHSQEAEIIVADNASTDNSIEVLKTEFPQVRRVILDKNWGFADGYNMAFRAIEEENKAKSAPLPDYYLLLNSDVRVEEGWLQPLLEYMDNHTECAACQPKLLSDIEPNKFEYAGACGGLLDRYGYPYCRGRIFDTVEEDHGQYDTVMPVLWATGACLMIRREDYWKAGGLDGRFFAHNEEIDLCWRLNIMRRKVVCIPQSTAYHLGGGTLPQGNPRKTYLNFRNNLTMLYKNLPKQELKCVMTIRLLLDYVAAFQSLLTERSTKSFKAIVTARRDFRKWKKDFSKDRKEIQLQRRSNEDTGRTSNSIIMDYHIRKIRQFSQL